MPETITVADVVAAAQCRKRAWLRRAVALPEGAEPTLARQMRAQLDAVLPALWPDARAVAGGGAAGTGTSAALAAEPNRPLLGAVLVHRGVRARLDVLARGCVVAVRAGTRLKDSYLRQAAVAAWVAEGAGCGVEAIEIACLDKRFVYRGDGDYRGLLRCFNVTERVRALLPEVSTWVAEAWAAVAEPPDIVPGAQCRQPRRCPFFDLCSPTTAEFPVSELAPGLGLKARLAEANIEDLREVPAAWLSKPQQRRIHRAVVTEQPQIEPGLVEFLGALSYPRYFLDFEAVQFAVPVWVGTRPLQSLPFQWSLHEERSPSERLHREFVDMSGSDPRRRLAEQLLRAVGDQGPILVYGTYERDALNGLAAEFPDLGAALRGLARRVVDLLPVVKDGYYHRDMHGGASLKAVLPTLSVKLDYRALAEVREGAAAQVAYLEAVAAETAAGRRQALERAMRDYCRMDTEALAELVRVLAGRD